MKTEKSSNTEHQYYINTFKELSKNDFFKPILYIGGGLIALYLGGKVMRILAGTVTDYKMLRTAIKLK
jgi:hypothetical protein